MVYVEQHVVLPSETKERVDILLQTLNTFQYKFLDLSEKFDSRAVSAALQSMERSFASIEHTATNLAPIFLRIDHLNHNIQRSVDHFDDGMKQVTQCLTLLAVIFGVLLVLSMLMCYLIWKKSRTGASATGRKRDENVKIK